MLPVRINAHPTKYRPSPASLTAILNVQKNNEGRVAAALMVDLVSAISYVRISANQAPRRR